MARAWLMRIGACFLIVIILAGAFMISRGRGADDIVALNREVVQLSGQGKYEEAAARAEKALALAELRFGKAHPGTLKIVNNLAMAYHDQGRHGEAEPLFRRVLEESERTLGGTIRTRLSASTIWRNCTRIKAGIARPSRS